MEREELLMDALWKMFQRRWALDKTVWRQASEDLNPTELRCIEYVGNHANVNATRLAEAFFMTTGATSKLTKKLLAKGFLVRYQKEKNRKEVYFRLTEEGERERGSTPPCPVSSSPSVAEMSRFLRRWSMKNTTRSGSIQNSV